MLTASVPSPPAPADVESIVSEMVADWPTVAGAGSRTAVPSVSPRDSCDSAAAALADRPGARRGGDREGDRDEHRKAAVGPS